MNVSCIYFFKMNNSLEFAMSLTESFDYQNDTNDNISPALPTETMDTFLSLMYGICIVFGIAANLMTIYIVLRHEDMHTTTNYFFCNLAVTDVCFLLFYGIPSMLIRNGISFKRLWLCRFVIFARNVSNINYDCFHF